MFEKVMQREWKIIKHGLEKGAQTHCYLRIRKHGGMGSDRFCTEGSRGPRTTSSFEDDSSEANPPKEKMMFRKLKSRYGEAKRMLTTRSGADRPCVDILDQGPPRTSWFWSRISQITFWILARYYSILLYIF